MKRIYALVTVLAVALLTLLPAGSAMRAEAAEAKNYAVKYCVNSDGSGEWRYQEGSVFDDDQFNREIYYLLQDLKAGDKVAVYNSESGVDHLKLGTVKLGDLTLCNTAMTVVETGGIAQCNILPNTTCSINGNVDSAHVYDVATVTFTGNVSELIATAEQEDFNSNITCDGTVGRFYAYSVNAAKTFYDKYNFQKDMLVVEDGTLKTEYYFYDDYAPADYQTPSVSVPAAPAAPVATPAAPTATPTAPAASDEYDDVPKTGDSNLILWFLAISVCGFAGSLALRKSAR